MRLLRRLGLRARMILAFAVGALLLSTMLSGIAWGLTRTNLVTEKESSASTQFYLNARTVRRQLNPIDPSQLELLQSLPTPNGSQTLLFVADEAEGQWFSPDSAIDESALPDQLTRAVLAGQPSLQRYDLNGEMRLAIGVPIPARQAAYFEIASLGEIDSNLESLAITLVAAALITTLAGAGFGAWMARRVLQPLTQLGEAAHEVATGNLDTRLGATDDPDLKPISRSFDEMVEALSLRIERDAQFASDVSHELRSPLMTLSASIEVLETRRDELSERSQAALDLLVADIDRFRQLVEDLLEISRFDAGVMQLELTEVHLAELVMQAVAFSHDEVPVEVDPSLAGAIVHADKRRLVRVIANLLDNARKYGGGATRVTIDKVGERVHLGVEDEGEGVSAEDRGKIFERFSRAGSANRRGATEGVGLGLALVAEHVNLHGGRVFVEDRPDGCEGARFVVDLPLEVT